MLWGFFGTKVVLLPAGEACWCNLGDGRGEGVLPYRPLDPALPALGERPPVWSWLYWQELPLVHSPLV